MGRVCIFVFGKFVSCVGSVWVGFGFREFRRGKDIDCFLRVVGV